MRKILFSLLAGFMLFPGAQAQAQYPEKNITMIVPYAAGGTTDLVARALAVPLSKELGVTVVIKNTTGGGATIGAAELAKARPDGYTIGFMPPGPIVLQQYQRKLPYSDTSFDYLGKTTEYIPILVCGEKTGWKNLDEMIAAVKSKPGEFLYGSPGVGSLPHIWAALLFKTLGIEVRHMPSTDIATSMAAMAGGTIQLFSESGSLVNQHSVTPLVSYAKSRSSELPDLPTLAELGIEFPYLTAWQGILAPKGIAADKASVLDEAIFKAVQDPSFQATVLKMDISPSPMRTAEFTVSARESMASYMNVMESLGFTKK